MLDANINFNFNIDLANLCAAIKEKLKALNKTGVNDNPFAGLSDTDLSKGLVKAIELLLCDRLIEGPGKGGWGQSDKIYAKELYGEEVAKRVEDSVYATVNSIMALRACVNLLRQSKSPGAHELLCKLSRVIYRDLDSYLERRWDKKYGWGGVLGRGRDNEWNVTISYRHTAWLLLLWLEDERYSNNIANTFAYLVDNFKDVDWNNQKVNTDVAVYIALKSILNHSLQNRLLDLEKIPVYLRSLEASILSKYDYEINGWSSELQNTQENYCLRQRCRQPYTLFVLAEMACCFKDNHELALGMKQACEDTMKGKWKVDNGVFGFAKLPGDRADLALSFLGASMLLRKPDKTENENKYLRETIEFLINSLINVPDIEQGVYLWPLSYFIKDTCEYLSQRRLN